MSGKCTSYNKSYIKKINNILVPFYKFYLYSISTVCMLVKFAYSLVYYKIRHEAKTAYSEYTIKSYSDIDARTI